MVFIYWGWDTALAVNEETKDKTRTPGLAAIFSTIILLVTYTHRRSSRCRRSPASAPRASGSGNPNNSGDVLSVAGQRDLRHGRLGDVLHQACCS